jgi:hypothetical protein
MTWLTAAKYADIRRGKMVEHKRRDGIVPLAILTVSAVAVVVLLGWLAFSEWTRCDPCEWVVMDAPMEGWQ